MLRIVLKNVVERRRRFIRRRRRRFKLKMWPSSSEGGRRCRWENKVRAEQGAFVRLIGKERKNCRSVDRNNKKEKKKLTEKCWLFARESCKT